VREFVCRRTGRTYQIGEQLDQDGQAVVHAVDPASSGLALKRYLPDTLSRRPDLEPRIKAMIANPPAYRTDRSGSVICAWPEDAASISGQFCGFVMPRIDTRGALTIHDVATSPHTTWRDRVTIAENLARAVAMLHDGDVVIGDFRGRNVLTWSDCRVTLLGCDQMQVVDPASGRRFPCVTTPDAYTPPELLLASLSGTLRTSSSDIFPLAVQLHLLLLQSAHPFRGQWRGRGDRPAEHVLAQDGLWAYAGDRRLDPDPGAAPLTVLPETLRQYFRAAFVDGARVPRARPPAHEWLTALVRLRESLVTCALEPATSTAAT
jgi:DNA-binding helix-hairpin-helix protein with protein kinase domain